MVNTVCPFWVHGSGGDLHQCLENALAAAWRRNANKDNADKRAKGKSPKKDPKVVTNCLVGKSILHQTTDQMHHLILTNTRPGWPYERQRRSLRGTLHPTRERGSLHNFQKQNERARWSSSEGAAKEKNKRVSLVKKSFRTSCQSTSTEC
jgi:hypothetical protein